MRSEEVFWKMERGRVFSKRNKKTFRKEREKFNGKWVSIQSEKRTFWERGVERIFWERGVERIFWERGVERIFLERGEGRIFWERGVERIFWKRENEYSGKENMNNLEKEIKK